MENLRGLIADFHKTPGVYLMKDGTGRTLYIGEAKDLLARMAMVYVASALLTPVALAGPVDLAPRFEYGVVAHYVSQSTIRHEIASETGGPTRKLDVKTESGMTLAVTAVEPDGSATIEWTLRYVAISAGGLMPGIEGMLNYDSRKQQTQPQTSPLAPLFSNLVNKPVTVRVDRSCKVLDFRGIQVGGIADPLGGLARGFMSKQAFEQLPLLVTAGAPRPVRRGSTWSKRTNIEMPLGVGSIVMDQSFKVKNINSGRHRAVIDMTGKLSKGATGIPSGSPGAGQALEVNAGSVKGRFHWDYRMGLLISAETRLILETELDSLLGRIRLTQDMVSTVKRVSARVFEQE